MRQFGACPLTMWKESIAQASYFVRCLLGNFLCFCCGLLAFFKTNFSLDSFRNSYRQQNCLDQIRIVPHDLLSVDNTSCCFFHAFLVRFVIDVLNFEHMLPAKMA